MTNKSRPQFFDFLDSDPKKAFELFYRFAWRELSSVPPPPMRCMDSDDRRELIHEIVYHCARNRFRVLRQYKNIGKSFSGWFYRVAYNMALENIRSKKTRDRAEAGTQQSEPRNDSIAYGLIPGGQIAAEAELSEVISKVRRALENVGRRCRLLLELAADEYSPKEITAVLGLPESDNKKVSNDLRYCRKKLRDLLSLMGIAVEDFL